MQTASMSFWSMTRWASEPMEEEIITAPRYVCPVCGYFTRPTPDDDGICPVCGRHPGMAMPLALLRAPNRFELPPLPRQDTQPLGFYGSEGPQLTAVTAVPSIHTPRDLYRILLRCWSRETCASRMRKHWSEENPTLGQCSITSFLAQDLFGGTVYGVPLENGFVHCYNRVGPYVFDLTSEQFGDVRLVYGYDPVQTREQHFAMTEKQERYELLLAAFRRVLESERK